MLKIARYPQNADGTPMDLEVGVLTDASGNNGARLTQVPIGPDGAPIETKGLVLVDSNGAPMPFNSTILTRTAMANTPASNVFSLLFLSEEGRQGWFEWSNTDFAALFGVPLTVYDPQ